MRWKESKIEEVDNSSSPQLVLKVTSEIENLICSKLDWGHWAFIHLKH